MTSRPAHSAPNPATGFPSRNDPVIVSPVAEPVTLAALFEAEESPLLRYALGLVGRRAEAEELVQDAFLRLHQVWREVQNPRAWLYRSLRNLALNHLRQRRDAAPLDADENPSGERLPDDTLARMEAIGMVETLIAEMAEDDRILLHLKYRDGLKYQEIGHRTGVSAGTVGYRLHHLLKQLADTLRRAGIEGSRG